MVTLFTLGIICLAAVILIPVILFLVGLPFLLLMGLLPWLLRIAGVVLLIKAIQKRGITILLIEHDMSLVMNICERIYVLDYGKVIAEGNAEEIRNNPRVITAYLGGE